MVKTIKKLVLCIAVAVLAWGCGSLQTLGTGEADKDSNVYDAIYDDDIEALTSYFDNPGLKTRKNDYEESIIFDAARAGNVSAMGVLLLEGFDYKLKNVFGETPLNVAAANNNYAVAALLSAWGANDISDSFGLTLLQKAEVNGFVGFAAKYNESLENLSDISSDVKEYKDDLQTAAAYFSFRTFNTGLDEGAEDWTDYIAKATSQRLEQWLALADYAFPAEVDEPASPPAVTLQQEKWETNAEFEQRVQKAQQARQKVINELQAKYRKLVEERNAGIVHLKQLQGRRIQQLPFFRSAYSRFALENMFESAVFSDVSLDKESGDLYLEGIVSGNNSIGSFMVQEAGKDLRQAAFETPESLKIDVQPFADLAGNFGIKGLAVHHAGSEYFARPASELEGEQQLLTASVGDVAEYAVPKEQNLMFIDRNAVGEITYKDGSKALTGLDDDLGLRISKLAGAEIDNTKWAFVIGAEKYMNSDDIIFARRSAELFSLAAVKLLGVPETHLITLYDEEATSGNIKSNLKKLLNQGISEGDSLYFYYNGHGVPNPSQGSAPYIFPTDMMLDSIADEPFYDLRNIYKLLENSKASEVLVFMDSCFTGQTDGRSVFRGKAAPRLAPRKIDLKATGKVAVITAGTESQFSSAWPEKGYRLFTYYLIDALYAGADDVDTLYSQLSEGVSRTSREIGGKMSWQDPAIQGNSSIEF